MLVFGMLMSLACLRVFRRVGFPMSLLSVNSLVTSHGDAMYTRTCQTMRHAIAKSSCVSTCSKAFLVGANFLFLVRVLICMHPSHSVKL